MELDNNETANYELRMANGMKKELKEMKQK